MNEFEEVHAMLRKIVPTKKTGAEPFHLSGKPLPFTVSNFWATAFSDMLTNMTRGTVAEYLVCKALGLDDQVMNDYDSYDAVTRDGRKIEVKCSAYLQRWPQKSLSKIIFDIRPRRAYDYDLFEFVGEPRRHSDIYVFSCHHHKDKGTVDPLDLTQWSFYVAPTSRINEVFPTAKTASLSEIIRKLSPVQTDFAGLKDAVESIQIPIQTTA